MLSKNEKFRKVIQKATQRKILFPNVDNQCHKPPHTLQNNILLISQHPFKSSQQIEDDTKITHSITQQTSEQIIIKTHNKWPQSCIGLVLCQYYQNSQTFYIYGTGTLIHNNIVLTSAQNIYCRRLKIQYKNTKFITGVSGNKCSGIYDVKRVYYPRQYTMQKYEDYNFAVLQLYDDLSISCGYLGLQITHKIQIDKELFIYGYQNYNKEGSFKLRQIINDEKLKKNQEVCSSDGILVKINVNTYYIVGLLSKSQSTKMSLLNQRIINMINQWTHLINFELRVKNLSVQGCMYLSQNNLIHLKTINLMRNNIDKQGCKYLSQANCIDLVTINLEGNNISIQGCKWLSQANWTYLTIVNLGGNKIKSQGCKYLSEARWKHLTKINLNDNNIRAQGILYLGQAIWKYLIRIDLRSNNIDVQGCKYLTQVNWIYLSQISLQSNNLHIVNQIFIKQLWRNAKISY